jgi:hypothetical protein
MKGTLTPKTLAAMSAGTITPFRSYKDDLTSDTFTPKFKNNEEN